MPDYTYLIVGGGMTADAAAQALHEAAPAGSIGLISAEPHPPYDRPPLSKALWKGEPEEKIWRKTAATGAALHLGRRITALDPRARSVTDDRGTVRSEEHTSELQSRLHLVCRLLLEKKKNTKPEQRNDNAKRIEMLCSV